VAVTTIDRTHYNSLVDDDGSGTTGSAWDKADVDSLLDAVDGLFANTNGISERGRSVTMGEWTGYTPSMVGITLGNGSLQGAYTLIGKTVLFTIGLIFGSTTTVTPATQIGFSAPVAHEAAMASQCIAQWTAYDDSTVVSYAGRAIIVSSPNFVLSYPNYAGAAGALTAAHITAPFTWATSDQLWIKGEYRANI
jgi:hypothetical protein